MRKGKLSEKLISFAYQSPKYSGKHIAVIGEKIHILPTGKSRVAILRRLIKKYPQETPTITYVPTEDTLILLL